MSTLTPTRKVSRKHELREDKVVTMYARILGVMENNRGIVYGALVGIVAVLAVVFGFSYVQSSRNDEAVEMMAQAVIRYENGEYAAAIDGDMSYTGLLEIIEDYGGTRAGNLARFYAADALYRMGELDRALPLFEAFDKEANFLGASAYAGEAAIYEARGDHARAADLYLRAAEVYQSDVTSPDYLQKVAREYAAAGNAAAAGRAYERIRDNYPTSTEAQNVDYYLAQIRLAE
jgi:tetratricopeptide (TPR) repeat protein